MGTDARTAVHLSHDFLFPKLHGMWARSLAGEELRRLIRGNREESLARALAPAGIDVRARADVQRRLTVHMIGELGSIMRLAGGRYAAFYAAFVDRYFFENLKTVLHYALFPDQDVPIEYLLIDAEPLPRFSAEEVMNARNTHQLFQQIPPHPCRDDLLPLLVELEDTRDLFTAEGRLDGMYYASLLHHCRRLPWTCRGAAGNLCGTEVDIVNLVMLMRNMDLYSMPADQVLPLCIEGGAVLRQNDLERLAAADRRAVAVEVLPRPYNRILAPLASAELYLSENALWDHLCALARDHFTDYQHPARSVAAFPYLKLFEVLNVGRVFEGIHFGLAPADIESMMIGID